VETLTNYQGFLCQLGPAWALAIGSLLLLLFIGFF